MLDRAKLSDPPDHSHGDEGAGGADKLLPAQELERGVGLLHLVVYGYLQRALPCDLNHYSSAGACMVLIIIFLSVTESPSEFLTQFKGDTVTI